MFCFLFTIFSCAVREFGEGILLKGPFVYPQKQLQVLVINNEKYTLPSDVRLLCLVYTLKFCMPGAALTLDEFQGGKS